jgi:hypothetical protein
METGGKIMLMLVVWQEIFEFGSFSQNGNIFGCNLDGRRTDAEEHYYSF